MSATARAVAAAMALAAMIVFAPAKAPAAPAPSLAEHVAEVVRTLPGRDSDAFVDGPPNEVDTAASAIAAARAGDIAGARAMLAPLAYEVHELETYLVIQERTPCQRCWGTYVINRSSSAKNVFVEIPHPLHDQNTPEFGVEAFQRTGASLLLLAGTHRYANGEPSDACRGVESDMARNDHSLFMAVHRIAGQGTVALQYHGFADRDGYPDVVLSNGNDTPPAELHRLRTEFTDRGIDAGVFDGDQWADLGATCNPQGKHSRATGGQFVHQEFRPAIRMDAGKRSEAVAAVLAVL
ncbi:hypothetical protein EV193_102398 [Herbihabitans rhizosphaerae]|uniref:Uncharacterized protein n=1 Tax=Herbihabitans rhizosphaerae TaxID=1872711 RepID=A0A4Q7L1M7_9PSEU|nr:hypothetical protein [Herbihabitans rhizosphaerae]RZS43419.1 hypothetical protein EV193_102398 [Herbihabitans rhizosphaerae]